MFFYCSSPFNVGPVYCRLDGSWCCFLLLFSYCFSMFESIPTTSQFVLSVAFREHSFTHKTQKLQLRETSFWPREWWTGRFICHLLSFFLSFSLPYQSAADLAFVKTSVCDLLAILPFLPLLTAFTMGNALNKWKSRKTSNTKQTFSRLFIKYKMNGHFTWLANFWRDFFTKVILSLKSQKRSAIYQIDFFFSLKKVFF